MLSLSNIPEPSHHAPDTRVPDAAQAQPPQAAVTSDVPTQGPTSAAPTDPAPSKSQEHETVDQQIDSVAVLLVLLIAGALLRLILGLLGPIQGTDPLAVEQATQRGEAILNGTPTNALPLFDLLAMTIASAGMPPWAVTALGSILTLAAVPAAFFVGKTLTDRHAAGIIAAAVVAVHPAVLTASNSFASPAIALAFVTLGLAALCYIDRQALRAAIAASAALALAALTGPACWIIGLAAGPVAYKLALRNGTAKALALALLITALSVAPALAYRATFIGTDTQNLLSEWSPTDAPANAPSATHGLLVTLTDPGFAELGRAMHLPMGDAGRLKVTATPVASGQPQRDAVADILADGWLLLNAGMAGLATISVGVMLARRRWAETLLLAAPVFAVALSTAPPSEALRLPMLALVGTLAMGLLATRSQPRIDEEAQEAKRQAKLAKQERKEQAKQERELQKHKDSLYAFDKPKPSKKTKKASEPETETVQEAILSEHQEEPPPIAARPI